MKSHPQIKHLYQFKQYMKMLKEYKSEKDILIPFYHSANSYSIYFLLKFIIRRKGVNII
jgi:hypothetical protein